MSKTHSVPSHNSKREDTAPADPTAVAKLQQAANLANENCDRATVLAQKLSAQLREAQSRINELELEADGLANRMRAETEAAVGKLQSVANARVERVKREADARIARVEADLTQAELRADRAEQWLVLIRREIEDHFMPSFAAMHESPIVAGRELSRPVTFAGEPSSFSVALDVASENEFDHKSS